MPVAATFDKFCKVHVRSQECESLPVRISFEYFEYYGRGKSAPKHFEGFRSRLEVF
jgi:hypothetical protein